MGSSSCWVLIYHMIYNMTSSTDDSDEGEDEEQDQPLDQMKDKLRELTEAHDLVLKHGHTMLRQLSDIEGDQLAAGTMTKVKEKIAMFKLTTGAMMKVSVVCVLRNNHINLYTIGPLLS